MDQRIIIKQGRNAKYYRKWSRKGECPDCHVGTGSNHKEGCKVRKELQKLVRIRRKKEGEIMAYMRGDYYIYRASSDTHDDLIIFHTPEGDFEMPIQHFDALCAMRYAQMEKEHDIVKFENEVIESFRGNFGCDALCEKRGVKTAQAELNEVIEKQKEEENVRK